MTVVMPTHPLDTNTQQVGEDFHDQKGEGTKTRSHGEVETIMKRTRSMEERPPLTTQQIINLTAAMPTHPIDTTTKTSRGGRTSITRNKKEEMPQMRRHEEVETIMKRKSSMEDHPPDQQTKQST